MVDLPKTSKVNGARIRWWQPVHGGSFDSDWAMDNILIGGNTSNLLLLQEGFTAHPGGDSLYWLQEDNTEMGPFCGSKTALRGVPSSGENVTLTTTDMDIQRGYMLQFAITLGCNDSSDTIMSPVYLQYSTDRGMSWSYLQEGCLPHQPRCNGKASLPSVYHKYHGWRRITLALTGNVISRYVCLHNR